MQGCGHINQYFYHLMLPSLRLVIYLGHRVIDEANTGADPFTGRPMQLTTQLRASSMIIYAA